MRVLALDTDGVDGDDSFIIANKDKKDQVYFQGDLSNPWEVGDASTTNDVAAFTHSDPVNGGYYATPHTKLKIVFAKDDADQWVTVDLDSYGSSGTGNPTETATAVPNAPTDRRTHTVEAVITKSTVYGSTNDAARVYFGYDQTSPDQTLGSYLHNPGATMTDIVSKLTTCLLYTSPSPRDGLLSRMPSSA